MSLSQLRKINLLRILFWVCAVALAVLLYLGKLDALKDILGGEDVTYTIGKLRLTPYKVLEVFVILVFTMWIAGRVSSLIERLLISLEHVEPSSRAIIVKVLNIILYTIIGLMVLYTLGIDITTITVLGGAIGIGVGFGLQKIASNFISGIILLFERSINEGDLIELGGGNQGFVRRIFARYTLVESGDGREYMIPNEDFITSRVTNFTLNDKAGRVDIRIMVSYDSDIHKVSAIALDIAKAHPQCSRVRQPFCHLREFGDFAVIFQLCVWIDDAANGKLGITQDILLALWDKFAEEGIKMAYRMPDQNIRTTEVKGAKGR